VPILVDSEDTTGAYGFPIFGSDGAMDETRRLAFRALDGTYPFPSTGGEFVFMADSEGLGMPPRELVRETLPGIDGALLREIRTLEREVFIPIWVASFSAHVNYLERLGDLSDLFQYRFVDYQGLDGTFDIEATSVNGQRWLRVAYSDGMRSTNWPTESAWWGKLGLTFLAVQPYWVGEDWTTATITLEGDEPDTFAEFPLEFSSSTLGGTGIPVEIGGNIPSWVTVDLTGPATAITITGPGLLISIPAGLAVGETAQIVTDPRSRTASFDGTVDWGRVGALSTWRPLNPGSQMLDLVMTGGAIGSSVRVSGKTRYERPW